MFKMIHLVILFLTLTGCGPIDSKAPTALNGVIDLSEWDFSNQGMVQLSGEWEFYWRELYKPEAFTKNKITQSSYIKLPNSWNSEERPGNGYATYRLKVITNSDSQLAIKVPYASTTYNMWVNGKLVATNGTVGTSKVSSNPQYQNKIVNITGTSDIIIQVSNFHHRRGGLFQALSVGTLDQIHQNTIKKIGTQLFLCGSFLMIGFYYLALFISRRKDKSHLFFGLFCILNGIHTLLVGEVFITQVIPHVNWELMLKTEYLSLAVEKFVFLLFLYHLFKRHIHPPIFKILIVLSLVFIFSIALSPASIFTRLIVVYQPTEIIGMIYIWSVFLRALRERDEGSIVVFISYTIYMVSLINDILFTNEVVYTGYFMHWGLLCFILGQSFILSRNFSKSFNVIEVLSTQLIHLNQLLEDKVKIRTKTITEYNKILEKKNTELSDKNKMIIDMEDSRRLLLMNISHELRTPMTYIQGYVEALLHNVIKEPEKKQQYLEGIRTKVINMDKLIEDLFELSRLEVKPASINKSWISLKKWIPSLFQQSKNDIQHAADIHFECEDMNGESTDKSTYVYIDPDRMNQVITNILFNAIKFTPKGGKSE